MSLAFTAFSETVVVEAGQIHSLHYTLVNTYAMK